MVINIDGKDITIKHSLRSVMCFEDATELAFLLANTGDIVRYMYCSATVYNDIKDMTLDNFADSVSFNDVLRFIDEIEVDKKKQVKPNLLKRLKSLLTSF